MIKIDNKKKEANDNKGIFYIISRTQTGKAMDKTRTTKRETIHKTQQGKLKTEQQKPGDISVAPEW